MKDDLQKTKQRTLRYWYVDGLSEMVFGFICLLLGGYFWLQLRLPSGSLVSQMLIIFFVLFVLGSGLAFNKAVTAIKSRLTYPRTGYVEYHRPARKLNWLAALLAMGIGLLTVIVINRLPGNTLWMPAMAGLTFSIIMLVVGIRMGLARFYLFGLFFLLLGGGLSMNGIGDLGGLRYFYAGAGACLLLSGAWVFLTYLRQTAPPKDGSNAG